VSTSSRSPQATPARSPRQPSKQALEKRLAQAERQQAFAAEAGWALVARLYGSLAEGLRQLLVPEQASHANAEVRTR
jgi:hypothetical protein